MAYLAYYEWKERKEEDIEIKYERKSTMAASETYQLVRYVSVIFSGQLLADGALHETRQ